MRLLRNSLMSCALLACIAATATAQSVLINFDTAPGGASIASGTDVSTTYSSVGVTFAREGGTTCGPSVYANNDQPGGFGSSPNVVSTCAPPIASDINGTVHGRIRADFASAATSVCIDVRPDGPGLNAVLSVYDVSDNLITSAASAPGVTQTLCATGNGIRRARFPGTGATGVEYARFDNLNVTFGAASVAAANVPTLSEFALLLLALTLAAASAWRLRRR